MKYEKKVILDLCGGTGAFSLPYRKAGFEVYVITLPDYDVTKCEICCVSGVWLLRFIHSTDPAKTLIIKIADIYGILAAPPCTEFSKAKGGAPRDFVGAMVVVSACLQIIWNCRMHGKPVFWAMENPVGYLRQFIGIPKFTFEQWQYGGDKVKATDLWGYFNPPKPTHTVKPENRTARQGRTHAADWSKVEYPEEYDEYLRQFKGNAFRAAARALTPTGFAKEFFLANSKR
jgi:site-specific DNA-cytosine methylase